MKKLISLLLVLTFVIPLGIVNAFAEGEEPAAETFDNEFEFDVNGIERKAKSNEIIVFPNETDEVLKFSTADYDFRQCGIMIFGSDGLIREAGGSLMPDSGSCQTFIKVPPHGFAVAYTAGKNTVRLGNARSQAMENAMLYNATMTIDREIYASFDKESMKLKVWYNKAPKVSDDAVRVLFVGNSSTYFNGSPIKFRALCRAAGIEVKVDYCTFGSAYLYEFADENHDRGKAYRNKLKNYKYDYIVFQGAAAETFEMSSPALDVLIPLAIENGAKPVLYMRYSVASPYEQMRINAEKHYKNYTLLGERYNCLVSPLAIAYLYCYKDNYPDKIELFAEDFGHHSPEGSYLIACSLMYTIFGVSPVGNTYTAFLDEDIVKILQDCAALAEETRYVPVTYDDGNYYKEGTTKYQNISEGKDYTVTGEFERSEQSFDAKWLDIDEKGKEGNKFTDGRKAPDGEGTQCAYYKGKTQSVTIDLGEKYALKAVQFDLYGNAAQNIPSPKEAKVSVSISNDGENFVSLGEAEGKVRENAGEWEASDFEFVLPELKNAKFVKLDFELAGDYLWLSEIKAFGTDAVEEPEEPSEEPSEEASAETSAEASKEDVSDVVSEPGIDNDGSTGVIIAIAAAVVVIAAAAAIIIAKKKKK